MSDKKDIQGKDESYYDAKSEEYKANRRPSKLHEMSLVAYVQDKDGTLKPVYREEQ